MRHVKGVTATMTVGEKLGKLMRHFREAIYNLKKYFCKLKNVKTPMGVKKNK